MNTGGTPMFAACHNSKVPVVAVEGVEGGQKLRGQDQGVERPAACAAALLRHLLGRQPLCPQLPAARSPIPPRLTPKLARVRVGGGGAGDEGRRARPSIRRLMAAGMVLKPGMVTLSCPVRAYC
jgi:hypothetical protein